jgi:predicted ATPase
MNTKLLQFQVTNFRSILDSGPITVKDSSCLVGTNESGKTNLLAALWKLNPANGEAIAPLEDYPRKQFFKYDQTNGTECFVRATFALQPALAQQLAAELRCDADLLLTVIVGRQYNGVYQISFPDASRPTYDRKRLIIWLHQTIQMLLQSDVFGKERDDSRADWTVFLHILPDQLPLHDELTLTDCLLFLQMLDEQLTSRTTRKQTLKTALDERLRLPVEQICQLLKAGGITLSDEQKTLVLNEIPRFIYYSDYGNLDSEIYLPYIIHNFDRNDLGEKERAKLRSLRVLFDFVRMKPEEILELGRETGHTKLVARDAFGQIESTSYEEPGHEGIERERAAKKRREVLLQSASSRLTNDFRGWWKQGDYRFRFQADGNHLRIWISDDKRPEEIELEGRSKGLQWFFSFFLVFMVERQAAHANCVLLLDEPGSSLHPIAQRDLLQFFHALSADNQLIYTTHSPFLVSTGNLGGIHILHVGPDGSSVISSDFRASGRVIQDSIYPVQAALGLTVAEGLLRGCQPVLVTSVADQVYAHLMQHYLIRVGQYSLNNRLVFVPIDNAEGLQPLLTLLPAGTGDLPPVLLAADAPGEQWAKLLSDGHYREQPNRLFSLQTFSGVAHATLEDLMPAHLLAVLFAKRYRGQHTDDFDDLLNPDLPIVPQMEAFARQNRHNLPADWRTELAQALATNIDRQLNGSGLSTAVFGEAGQWAVLFEQFSAKKLYLHPIQKSY